VSEKQVTTIYLSPEILKELRIEQARRGLRNLGDLIEDLWRAYSSAGQQKEERPYIQLEKAKKITLGAQETKEDILEQRRQRYIAKIPEILKDPAQFHYREILHAAEALQDQDPDKAALLMAIYRERKQSSKK